MGPHWLILVWNDNFSSCSSSNMFLNCMEFNSFGLKVSCYGAMSVLGDSHD